MASKLLSEYMQMANIASEAGLDEETLTKISQKVWQGYQLDLDSQAEWLRDVDRAIDLAKLKKSHTEFPWRGAANVKFPLITTASLQSAARMYPEIVRNGRVVEAQVVGADPDGEKQKQASRVVKYMTYQLLGTNEDWEEGTDKLLHILPVIGTAFRKTFFNPIRGQNEYEVCLPHEVIVNNSTKTLESAPRVNHVFRLSQNEIMERMRAGIYTYYDFDTIGLGYNKDNEQDYEDCNPEVLEQHGFLDLDEDGYAEPYIITRLSKSGKILRIVARFNPRDISYNGDDEIVRIEPTHYFTDYHFIPSNDGTFYSQGFGTLLLPLNETINTLVNQLLNAGSLASLQGGFIGGGLKLKGGNMPMTPGEWRRTETIGMDIAHNIVPIQYKEPSPVLMQLLTFLIDHTDKLTSVTDALTGQERTQNSPATSITSMIEQGLKVFSSIMRRMHRSFKKEFSKIYRLNSLFVDPEQYMQVLGEQVPVFQDEYGNMRIMDFDGTTFNVIPISDPNIASDTLRAAQNQLLLSLLDNPHVGGKLNPDEILRRVLEANNIAALERVILRPEEQPAPPPDPDMIKIQMAGVQSSADMHMKEMELQLQSQRQQVDIALTTAQIEDTKASSVLKLAQAQAVVSAEGLKQLELQVDLLKEDNKQVVAHIKNEAKTTGALNEKTKGNSRKLAPEPSEPSSSEIPGEQQGDASAGPIGPTPVIGP